MEHTITVTVVEVKDADPTLRINSMLPPDVTIRALEATARLLREQLEATSKS